MTVTRVPSPSLYASGIGFSAGVRAGDLVLIAGTTAVATNGRVKIGETLLAAGARLDQVVQTRMYITDPDDWQAVGRAHGEVFSDVRPAAAMVVTRLLDARMRVEIEAAAYARLDAA